MLLSLRPTMARYYPRSKAEYSTAPDGTLLDDIVNRWGAKGGGRAGGGYGRGCVGVGMRRRVVAAASTVVGAKRMAPMPNARGSVFRPTSLAPAAHSNAPFDRLFNMPPANGFAYTHKEVREGRGSRGSAAWLAVPRTAPVS